MLEYGSGCRGIRHLSIKQMGRAGSGPATRSVGMLTRLMAFVVPTKFFMVFASCNLGELVRQLAPGPLPRCTFAPSASSARVQWPNEVGSNTHQFFASHGSHASFSIEELLRRMLPSGGSHSQHLHQITEALSTTVPYADLQLLGVHKSWP